MPGQRDQHGDRLRRRRDEHLQRHGHRHQQLRVVVPVITGTTPSLNGGTLPPDDHAGGQLQRGHEPGRRHRRELPALDRGPRRAVGHLRRRLLYRDAAYSGTTATLTFSALTQNIYRLTVQDTITERPASRWTATARSGEQLGHGFRRSGQPCRTGQRGPGHRGNNALRRRGGRLQRRRHCRPGRGQLRKQHRRDPAGQGPGGFSLAETLIPPAFPVLAVAVGNFNTGGKLDLAVTSYTSRPRTARSRSS